MYKTKYRRPISYDFDLIVIGSGAGGSVAAHIAAADGKKVGIIEASSIGGDCAYQSCIPTKALLKAAETLETVQSASQFGIRTSAASFNYRSVQAWKNKTIASTGVKDEANSLKSNGISIVKGHAHFITPWIISVGIRRYSAKTFLIATGSKSFVPNIPGLTDTGYITYKEAGNLEKLPKSVFIIGGGATAYEYAQIFSVFGSRVHIAESHPHILPKEDSEVGDSAMAALQNRGVRIHTSCRVVAVSGKKGRKVVTFEQHGQQHRVAVEEIMVASGKVPTVDIGLENTGIRYSDDGVVVNRHMQTTKKHIFAAGDVTGNHNATHIGIQESRVAVHNMYHHRRKIVMDYHAIPQVFYGKPEIAVVGKNERELKLTGELFQTSIAPIGILGRSITSNYSAGFVKLTATHSGILLGASIVAPDASEMIGELALAIKYHHHACDVANTVHAFPTWSEAIRIAASQISCI